VVSLGFLSLENNLRLLLLLTDELLGVWVSVALLGLLFADELLGVRVLVALLGLLILANELLGVGISTALQGLLTDKFLSVWISAAG